MKKNTSKGRLGEDEAARFLAERGYRIVARNYRRAYAEADIIAWQEETLVFIEVKARSSLRFGTPTEAVTPAKRMRLSKIALDYMMEQGLDACPARFDVVSVMLNAMGQAAHISLVENAFEAAMPEAGP